MKKAALILVTFVLLAVGVAAVSAGEIAVVKSQDSWVITYDDTAIGSLKKSPEGNFMLYGKEGEYVGLLLKSGSLKLPGSYPLITPKISQLHLDAVKALDIIGARQSGN